MTDNTKQNTAALLRRLRYEDGDWGIYHKAGAGDVGAVAAELIEDLEARNASLSKLHEVATERTVALAAVIEQAKADLVNPGTDGPRTDAPARALRAHTTLKSADTDMTAKALKADRKAALREIAKDRQSTGRVSPEARS